MGGTMEGLSVPINGGYTAYTSTGTTSYLVVSDIGCTKLTVSNTAAAANAFDVRYTGAGSTFQAAGNFQLTLTSAVTGGQQYALRAHFDGSSATTIGGGREACLALYMNANSSAGGSSHSMIVVDDAGSDVQAFISFVNIGTSGGMIVANAAADATHGIRIYIDSTAYYIMCTTCVD